MILVQVILCVAMDSGDFDERARAVSEIFSEAHVYLGTFQGLPGGAYCS